MGRVTGQLRNLNEEKNFAFIVHGANRDIFLHKSQFIGDWNDLRLAWTKGGVELEFEIIEGPKGLRAMAAKLI